MIMLEIVDEGTKFFLFWELNELVRSRQGAGQIRRSTKFLFDLHLKYFIDHHRLTANLFYLL